MLLVNLVFKSEADKPFLNYPKYNFLQSLHLSYKLMK